MRSIRLSLTLFFLGLFGLALGAVSASLYRTAGQTLKEKEETTRELVETQYREKCDKERARLDESLLYQARTLARLAQFRFDFQQQRVQRAQFEWHQEWRRHPLRGRVAALGLLAGLASPGGPWTASTWAFLASPSAYAMPVFRMPRAEIQLDENELLQLVEGEVAQYFQIDSAWGSRFRSASLGDESFPVGPDVFEASPILDWAFDEFELSPDQVVRRVSVLVTSPGRLMAQPVGSQPGGGRQAPATEPIMGPPRPGRGEGTQPGPGGRPGGRPPEVRWPALLVQCATETDGLDVVLAKFEEERDIELARLVQTTEASLLSLKRRLLAVSLAAFGAVLVGTVLLVSLGLAPLRRLSEAVSQVSERDFRLKFDAQQLPSELKPITDRLQGTLEQLKHAFDREKQAVADISHELRTPVAALLTTVEVALRKPRGTQEYLEVLRECRRSGQEMGQLVERLLTLARLDAGVDRLRVEEVDVADLAEQCTALVKPLAAARGLEMRLHTRGPAVLRADPAKLREVLTNLLHNAIEYNRDNGSVDVAVVRENGMLEIEVKDTGVGIPAEARAHLFERFYRVDPSRHSEGLHAGLGLAIVKGYVDLMGGSIGVESDQGRGSTFRVKLPAA